LTYKEIIAKPEEMDSRILFKIVTNEGNINFETLKFVWNNSSIDFNGKISKISNEPVLDLSLAEKCITRN